MILIIKLLTPVYSFYCKIQLTGYYNETISAKMVLKTIRIFHECEVPICPEGYRLASRGSAEGQIFRSVPHTHDIFFFLPAHGRRHMNKNQIYLEILCIRVSHFDFDVILWCFVTSCLTTKLRDVHFNPYFEERAGHVFILPTGLDILSHIGLK